MAAGSVSSAALFVLSTVAVLLGVTTTHAQLPPLPQGCGTQVAVLLPCLPFVQGNQSTNPSSQCCNALGGVVATSPVCLCALVAAGPGNNTGVNATLALGLPSRCKMSGVSASLCNNITGTTTRAPAPAPVPVPGPSTNQSAQQAPAPRVPISTSPAPGSSGDDGSRSVPVPSSKSSPDQTLDSAPDSETNALESAATRHLLSWIVPVVFISHLL